MVFQKKIIYSISFFLQVAILSQITYTAKSQNLLTSSMCLSSVPLKTTNKSGGNFLTNETISETGLTVPSLWWAQEQFDPFNGRLINHWLANPEQKQIDLVVNRQLWSLLDYLERYRFVNNMGTVATEYGYNLRIVNRENRCLAIYQCNFQSNPNQCQLYIDSSGRQGLQVEPSNSDWQ